MRMFSRLNRVNPQQGFTLFEILLVIGVAAVLAIAALLAYTNSQGANQAKQEKDHVVQIATNIRIAFLGSGYTALDTGVANQAKVFPVRMNQNNYAASQPITSMWGPVEVGPSPTNFRRFVITYHQVPAGLCRHFVTFLATAFDRVAVDGEPAKDFYADPRIEYDPVTAITRCTQSEDGKVDVVIEGE